ncbi:MAG TPA: hypothetical protein PKH07_16530, partial [bacterium]|nr:hypothetical protein [bacterium]
LSVVRSQSVKRYPVENRFLGKILEKRDFDENNAVANDGKLLPVCCGAPFTSRSLQPPTPAFA